MDIRDQDEMWGAITALNHLMEHLWAFQLTVVADESAAAVARTVRDKMLAEFDIPSEPTGKDTYAAGQYAIAMLEDFWDRMEQRVAPGD